MGVDVELESGPYGQVTVLVDGAVAAATNWTGWLPGGRTVVGRVKTRLAG